jgi:hypothetical protein
MKKKQYLFRIKILQINQFPKKYLLFWHKKKKITLLSAILMQNRIHMVVRKIIIMVQLWNIL